MAKRTREWRKTKAIHLDWTTNKSREEIADRLDVHPDTVTRYLNEQLEDEVVDKVWRQRKKEIKLTAVEELRHQLKQAGQRSKSAEKPVKVWEDENGDMVVREESDDSGEVVDRYAVPEDIELAPDEKARYFGRQEVREILELLCDITGVSEPDELEVKGDLFSDWTDSAGGS